MPWEVLCLERLDVSLEGDLLLEKVGCLRASLAIYSPPTSNFGLSLPSHLSRCEHAPVALDHLPPCLLATVDCIPSSHVPEEILPLLNCVLSDIWPQRDWKPFTPWLSLLGRAHMTPSKHVWLLSACCFLRLSMLSHTVLTCRHHSCAGCSSTGISSRGLQATLHPGKEDNKFLLTF